MIGSKFLTTFCYAIVRGERKTIESKKVERRDARAAASRFARGNVPLQHGAFISSEDLETERQQSQYTFR